MTRRYQRPRPLGDLPPVIPGLGPDSLAGLSPQAVSARVADAEARAAAAERGIAAQALADRVAAIPPRVPPREPPKTPRPPKGRHGRENGPDGPLGPRWRQGDLIVPTRPTEPLPTPEFTPGDLAVLARLIGAERARSADPAPTTPRPPRTPARTSGTLPRLGFDATPRHPCP